MGEVRVPAFSHLRANQIESICCSLAASERSCLTHRQGRDMVSGEADYTSAKALGFPFMCHVSLSSTMWACLRVGKRKKVILLERVWLCHNRQIMTTYFCIPVFKTEPLVPF